MSLPSATSDETALFRQAWTLYDTITAMNYMFHREIYAVVADFLKRHAGGGKYRLLDLGCGNARFMAPCLKLAPPMKYVGVDLSAAALAEARDHLAGVSDVTLQQQDMLTAVEELTEKFEVIFTSFAVHHLDADQKQILFRACAARLPPGGVFLMVDVVREEGESRATYLDRYLSTMRQQWTAVQPDLLEEACSHVAAYDFPETLPTLRHMAQQAGFKHTRLLQRHAEHHVIAFSL